MGVRPLVSVFIPYYNDEKYLRISIESVLNQTYENWELILLNHATTDNCREIAHSYNDCRIKHIDMEKNYGAGGGILFTRMLQVASGKYLKPLCADDELLPNALEDLVNYMELNPDIDFAFGNVEYIDAEGKDLKQNWFEQREKFSTKYSSVELIKLYIDGISIFPYIGSIIKTNILKTIEYNKNFIMLFDMSIWFSLLCKGYQIGYFEKIIANYRIHENQVSTVSKERWAAQVSWYEHSVFWEILFLLEDIEMVKKIFCENKLCENLKDKKDIPFIVANSLLEKRSPMTYVCLNKMFNDMEYLKHIEETFGWGVRELRAEIGKMSNDSSKTSKYGIRYFKNKYIYSKNVKDLKFWQIIYLFLNRIFYVISLKPIRKRLSKKKKYSL